MTDFVKFNQAIQKQFKEMQKSAELFRVEADRDAIWDQYLAGFPEGTNPMYRERTEHDCNCCKNFIRDIGDLVAIVDGRTQTIWDITLNDDCYQVVADKMAEYVRTLPIRNVYRHYTKNVGTPFNHQQTADAGVIKWEHFNVVLPSAMVISGDNDSIQRKLGDFRTNQEVLKRSLEELSLDAIEIVSDLIDQNAIYRGQEHGPIVKKLREYKRAYAKLKSVRQKELFLWEKSAQLGGAGRFRNTVIGTLIDDLSAGTDLDTAVRKFEQKVAPTNYKRPTALITKGMVKKAEETVEKLGIEPALHRRYAVVDDITINNVLFADRSAKKKMKGVFDTLEMSTKVKKPSMEKVQEMGIDEFVEKVLPQIDAMEVMVSNRHTSNFVSLIAPKDEDAKHIFKWDNNFSWSYNGEVTDSIKERVKSAGGQVDADARASLSWYNLDDLDLSVVEPNGNRIYFGERKSRSTGGELDVDMNAGMHTSEEPVENIFWKDKSRMAEGEYKVEVHNFSKRAMKNTGFEVELEFGDQTVNLSHPEDLGNGKRVTVAKVRYSKKDGFTITPMITSTTASKEVWGIGTEQFQKVKMMMASPNHWDGQGVGNKHWFFMLDKCVNPDQARGFYNEFLTQDLAEHRKVFEVLSSKLKTEESDDQLSGLGFSSTKEGELLCKVSGSFNRILKIKF